MKIYYKLILGFSFFTFSFSLTQGQGSVFYGMTTMGGSLNKGAIISFDPSTNSEDTVHSFGSGKDGFNTSASFVFDTATRLFYAMTFQGGGLSQGAIISFNPASYAEDTVHSFGNGIDGASPDGNNLVYDAGKGLYYAMTYLGGSQGDGAIISFNASTHAEVALWGFGSGTDGVEPIGTMVYDATNKLFYGMTNQGGKFSDGAIISFDPSTNAEDTVHSFGSGKDGRYPITSLVYNATTGLFYGMTYGGGSAGSGALISYNPTTHVEDTVHSFGRGSDGAVPDGNDLVYYAATGLYYGMTYLGGSQSKGVIFTFNPSTQAEAVVWSFGSGTDGVHPMGSLVYYAATGLFYGMTNAGGSQSKGAIISFNPTTHAESAVHSFGTGMDGSVPHFANLTLYTPPLGIDEVKAFAGAVSVYPNPNNGAFTLRVESEKVKVESATVEIYNTLGEKVYSNYQITKSSNYQIDLSNQPAGVYFYKVVSDTGSPIGQGKIVIER